jgi:hypothetical protein
MSLILSGTDGLSDVDGSAATPAIRGTDANTGIFFPAADTIAFAEGGVEAMRLDSAGNFGQGVTPSAWGSGFTALQVKNASLWSTGNDASLTANAYYDGTNYRYIGTAGATRQYHNTDGTISWSQAASGTAGNAITFTQAMTLNASGQLILGDTTADGRLKVLETAAGAGVTFYNSANNSAGQIGTTNEAGAANSLEINAYRGSGRIVFKTNNTYAASINSSGNLLVGTTTALGTLTVNGTVSSSYTGFYIGEQTYRMQVASGQIQVIASSGGVYLPSGGTGWGSLSDENLKNITGLITNGIDAVKSLRAARYTWKSDETNKPQVGLIAQDIRAVLPEAVDENSDGFLGVRYSDVIPLLVAAIQEQQALITTLTDRITALESA